MDIYVLAGFLVHFGAAIWAIYHNLLFKRDTRAALSWIMICLLVPYLGPLTYYLFGINRIQRRAQGLKRGLLAVAYEIADHKPAKHTPESLTETQSSVTAGAIPYNAKLARIGYAVSGRNLVNGNQVSALHNGDAVYPAMLLAIENATKCVYLTSYIFKSDRIGKRFIDALSAARERGVDVKVIVDGVGNLYSFRRSTTLLRNKGLKVVQFLPPTLIPPSVHINLRNHRKILTVDNTHAFIGGMNISDDNLDYPKRLRSVTDMHFEVSGPVVDQLTSLFNYDWHYAHGHDAATVVCAISPNTGDMACRLIPDGPDESLDALAVTIQTVISSATERVVIMTPYFLPSREMLSAIQSAAIRGVTVQIVLPLKNNLFYMHWANRNLLAELLNWGVEIYYQPAPFCHTKLLCVDRSYSLIGSANLDQRSLRLNFELGLEVFSKRLNTQLVDHVHEVIQRSTKVTYQQLASRSVLVRLRDSLVSMMSPYL